MEYAFNVCRDNLKADRSYLRDGRIFFTYKLLNLLSPCPHEQIFNMIGMKYSVRNFLLRPSMIKMYTIEKQEIMGWIPRNATELVADFNVNFGIIHKKT